MTVGVCFYFEDNDVDVWSGRSIDLDAWNYAIKAAGDIKDVVIINRTNENLRTLDASLKFRQVATRPILDGRVTHVIRPWDDAEDKVDLWSFDHQTDWYLFGPASGWQRKVSKGVYIPQSGRGALHSVHVATAVMLHRYKVMQWQ